MLQAVRIKRSMPDYGDIVDIYKSSFPEAEQFPVWLLRLGSHLRGASSTAFYDEGALCGFAYCLANEETVFILFLAVSGKVRSKGYGSQILSWVKGQNEGKTVFLDVEAIDESAPNNGQRVRRVAFYERNGIHQTGSFFSYDGVTYEILSTDRGFTEKDYDENLGSFFRVFRRRRRRRG